MARISYVDPGTVTDPELAGYLADAREHGTPRLESQAIRAHVPAVLRTFSQSWQQVFRDGVLDHRVKELARVFIAKSLECGYCAAQRSDLGAAQGLDERAFDEVINFRQSQLLTAGTRPRCGGPRRSPGTPGWPMMTCGPSCTATSPSPNWSSWAISSA